ncbi:GNAT family N-acetyltransferase [Streptomyces sp. 3MP-14]|uniref:GNAT family N-acetyltransferase n=1 Tax=Streptomyces mimosae TaxID=2586635 RepID=A0A5N6A3B8_9ACTN|nr:MULTISPECIES: GNAT family N-acetyltransferase [Streptomyces]KAB8162200.1 GNAT family N-acetyltransferase [Streptomyces mimosae]KAB8173901.1 GNAT family N-acetyltransferase [Streptomyces sp. 3MP-14]
MDVFLKTERLRLRPFTERDAGSLLALDSDPEVMRYITGGRPTSAETLRLRTLPRLLHDHPGWAAGRGYWAAEERSSGVFLGWFEFRPLTEQNGTEENGTEENGAGGAGTGGAEVELGYRLAASAWGRGLATEGASALVDRGFTELRVARVTANTMAVNARSRRVMEKVGLRLVRAFAGDWPEPIPGSEHGEVEYALTREEWAARRPAPPAHAHQRPTVG